MANGLIGFDRTKVMPSCKRLICEQPKDICAHLPVCPSQSISVPGFSFSIQKSQQTNQSHVGLKSTGSFVRPESYLAHSVSLHSCMDTLTCGWRCNYWDNHALSWLFPLLLAFLLSTTIGVRLKIWVSSLAQLSSANFFLFS